MRALRNIWLTFPWDKSSRVKGDQVQLYSRPKKNQNGQNSSIIVESPDHPAIGVSGSLHLWQHISLRGFPHLFSPTHLAPSPSFSSSFSSSSSSSSSSQSLSWSWSSCPPSRLLLMSAVSAPTSPFEHISQMANFSTNSPGKLRKSQFELVVEIRTSISDFWQNARQRF